MLSELFPGHEKLLILLCLAVFLLLFLYSIFNPPKEITVPDTAQRVNCDDVYKVYTQYCYHSDPFWNHVPISVQNPGYDGCKEGHDYELQYTINDICYDKLNNKEPIAGLAKQIVLSREMFARFSALRDQCEQWQREKEELIQRKKLEEEQRKTAFEGTIRAKYEELFGRE